MDVTSNIEPHVPRHQVATGRVLLSSPSQNGPCTDIAEIFKKTWCAAGLKPVGRDLAQHTRDIGSIPLPMMTWVDRGALHGEVITVTGRTIAENLKTVEWNCHQDVLRSTGHMARTMDSDSAIVNGNFTDQEAVAHPSERDVRATNHLSGALWDYARRVGAAKDGAVMQSGRAHEKQYHAKV